MIHVIRSFSVRPLRNYDNLSMNKVYPVLWIDSYGYYNVRGNNGVRERINVDDATIEAEV